ncbi:hypothetical protein Scep_017277 [Stephania cephalantha]|uniref:Transposase, Ptta/En/Spm, plant n=1 Tax=Stephania cephalantha TaxID=152367 RepID=A0AAP0NUV2_9MAGN
MTKIFKRGMITEGYCWKSVPDHQKDIYWERWKPYFQWDPSIDEAIVRATYDAKACVKYGTLMHELRALGVRPDFMTNEASNRYRKYWVSTDFKARSEKASHNRKSEKNGSGTCPSKHIGGSRSFQIYGEILALDKDEDDVTPNDVELVRKREEHTQGKPNQAIDEVQLYYDAAGDCPKGFVYGLGKHLSGTIAATNSRASSAGWDGFGSFTENQHVNDDRDIQDWVDKENLGDES